MAQDSFPWGCNPATGDAGAVTVNDLVNAQQFGSNPNPNQDGVVYWTSTNPLPGGTNSVNGLLNAVLDGNRVHVATGIGIVQGWNFVNDVTVTFNFATDPGNASATDLIVLERGDPATDLTVRLARVKGAASSTATVTQSEALWQVEIARVTLDAGGLPTDVVDRRRFVGQVMSWRQGGGANPAVWLTPGTTNWLVGNVKIAAGCGTATVLSGQNSASVSITLPVEFSTARPLIYITPYDYPDLGASEARLPLIVYGGNATETALTFGFLTKDFANATADITVNFTWMVLGIL
jgi:hypothetical protein